MPTYPTSVQRETAITLGSAKFEYTLDGGSTYNDLGLGRAITVTENIVKAEVAADNGPSVKQRVADHTVTVAVDILEFYWPNIAQIRGGSLDLVSTTAGTPVAGASQVIASGGWSYSTPVEIEGQNGDGTAQTINSVTGSVDGVLVVGDDYDLVKLPNGRWAISITDSTTVTTETQDITVNYDYTPAASVEWSTGGLSEIGKIGIRLTNVEDVSGTLRNRIVTVYKATIDTGVSLPFQDSKSETSELVSNISFTGELDTDRTAGDQLFKIVDEVATS